MTVAIREVRTNQDLQDFINVPLELYKGNPYYVPALRNNERNTLKKDKNPAFEYCQAAYWLAYQDNHPVGRIAGIINHRHFQKWNQPFARFGWLDFIDDRKVSGALFSTVENWAAAQGMQAVHGPLGFTDLDRAGLLVAGFDQPGTLATIYNHPYYPEHLTAAGYSKDVDWVEYQISVPSGGVEKITRLAEAVARRYHLHLKHFNNKREMLHYANAVFELLEEAYQHLYAMTPFTRRQMDDYIKQNFGFLSPDFVPAVVDEQDQLVAFGISMPSLSRALQRCKGRLLPFGFIHLLRALRKNNLADLYLIAVKDSYQGKGVTAMLMAHMIEVFKRFGITTVESNPELENNLKVQSQWKHFEHRQHKRRRCYIKYLQ